MYQMHIGQKRIVPATSTGWLAHLARAGMPWPGSSGRASGFAVIAALAALGNPGIPSLAAPASSPGPNPTRARGDEPACPVSFVDGLRRRPPATLSCSAPTARPGPGPAPPGVGGIRRRARLTTLVRRWPTTRPPAIWRCSAAMGAGRPAGRPGPGTAPPGPSSTRRPARLTTAPNELLDGVHDRMPVILPQRHYQTWLTAPATEAQRLTELLVPFDASVMQRYPVSPLVNKPENDVPDCALEVPSPETQGQLW